MCIRDRRRVELRVDEHGEVLARGNVVLAGYWREPEASAAALADDWFHTGDGGHLDEDGYLVISDRKKDVIITGGENVSSIEVEDALCSHPAVAEAAVIGVPDDRWGETVKALVVLAAGQQASEAEALMKKKATQDRPLCRPKAAVGASWILLGEPKRGEKLLTEAIRGIDPENNATEHRRAVAEALTAVGRVREAIEHLTSSASAPSWTETPAAIMEICPRASVEELSLLLQRMKQHAAHNEFILLERGLDRLIALKAWDAAVAWIPEFDGLSTRSADISLATAMVAAGEPRRAESALAAGLAPKYATCAEYLLDELRATGGLRLGPQRRGNVVAPLLGMVLGLARAHFGYHLIAGRR